MPETKENKKDAVLRFLHKYPVNYHFGEWIYDDLLKTISGILNIKPTDFNDDLKIILSELAKAKLINHRNDNKVGGGVAFIQQSDIYSITDLGREQSNLIQNEFIIDAIPDKEIKDYIILDLIINKISPYGIIDFQKEWLEYFKPVTEQRKLKITDPYSKTRILELLKKNGLIKQIDEKQYKFNKRGRTLIEKGSYNEFVKWENQQKAKENERQDLSDRLLRGSVVTSEIQKNLLSTNRWIAVATVVAGVYYTSQMFDFYQAHLLNYCYLGLFPIRFNNRHFTMGINTPFMEIIIQTQN